MLFHVLCMVWCPVGCAHPLPFLHGIAGDYIDSDVVNVEFQIGMLGISIDCLSMNPFSNRRKNPPSPFLPIHCRRKVGEKIKVGLAAQPSVRGDCSLVGTCASNS